MEAPPACLAPAAAVGQKQPSLSSCRWGDGILGFPLTCRIQAQMQHVDYFDTYLPSVRRTAQCLWVRLYPGGQDQKAVGFCVYFGFRSTSAPWSGKSPGEVGL